MELPEINWGLFIILFAIGFVSMLGALKIWAGMDFEIGIVTKIIMLTVIPCIGAYGFSWWLENN